MKRFAAHTLFAIAGPLVLSGAASAGVVVGFDEEETTAHVGQMFEVRIVMTTDESILGWGLDLTIVDDSIASLTAPTTIGPLWDAFATPDGDDLGGLAFPDPIGPGNDYLIATLTFTAHQIGETELQLSITAADLTEGFANNTGGFASITFEPGTIIVVPAPGVAAFLMIGLAAPRRRRT